MTEINHTEYPKTLKGRSEDALRYTIKDATEAMLALPEGHKAGYYADEVHYCAMELTRRQKNTERFGLRGALDQTRAVCEPVNVSRGAV